jgi:hypothetical protein
MGESAGDLMAMSYLNDWRNTDSTLVGDWATSNDEHGIRNYDMAFPSSGGYPQPGRYPEINPLNFGAVGYDITGPQVHADGEIWSATNHDLRELFLQRYPSRGARTDRECVEGRRPAEQCSGARRWIQIMFDSFLIMPTRPTFLDARDAQLAADMVRFGGANQDILWLGFARRGFGENALTTDANDSEPRPDFESPRANEATVTFEAVAKDEGRQPVPARIYVGHYEARVSPIADTDPATAGDTPATGHLDNVARFVPGERGGAYDFVANAPGYGHVRFRLSNLRPGENRRVRLELPTNWASQAKGATASGDGTRHGELIDDTEGTNWESTGQPVEGRQVLVRLDGERRFDRLKVSAMLLPATPSQNRFTALRQFEVLACEEGDDRRNPTCDPAVSGGFDRVLRSQDDAFPSVPARPVAPELALRNWSVRRTSATHVLFRVLHNQCTGQSAFQGTQDADPTNETDCRVPGALPARNTEVRAAELQLLSSRPSVSGAQAVE